jgi:hypothetical protein
MTTENPLKTEVSDRYIPLPDYSSYPEYLETHRQIADKDIQVGDAATYYVGSDSYADTVTEVVRFKEGKRAGQIKYIKLSHKDEKYLAYATKCSGHAEPRLTNEKPFMVGDKTHYANPICPTCWLAANGAVFFRPNADAYWCSVIVGYAKQCLDPSF